MLLDITTKDSLDRSVILRIIDSTDGTPETGVVWNTASLALWYRRDGGIKVPITTATLSALSDAHADGGFLHISDGNYRLDIEDAAFATGANFVDIGGTVTGMIVIGGRVRLTCQQFDTATSAGYAGEYYCGIDYNLLLSIKAKTDLIGSSGATIPARSTGSRLTLFVGEEHSVSIATATDFSANTMYLEFRDREKDVIDTIADGSLTKSDTSISFNATATLTASERVLSWALRDLTTDEVYIFGKAAVTYPPTS